MTSKHTPEPGPWYHFTRGPSQNIVITDSPNAADKALSSINIIALIQPMADNVQAIANAEFIAAAPDTSAERDRLKWAFENSDRQQVVLIDANKALLAERDSLKAANAELLNLLEWGADFVEESVSTLEKAADFVSSGPMIGPADTAVIRANEFVETARAVIATAKENDQ